MIRLTLCLLCALAPAAALAAPLERAAQSARVEAERALQGARAARLEARTALMARLARAQRGLEGARRQAEAAARRRAAAEAEAQQQQKAAKARRQRGAALRDTLSRAGGLAAWPQGDDLAATRATLMSGLEARLDRLSGSAQITVSQREIHDRRGQPVEATVIDLGGARALAVGAGPESTGLLTDLERGQPRVAGPWLSEAQIAALQGAAQGAPTALPIDVVGDLTEHDAPKSKDMMAWLESGGLFVWPILALGLAAVLVALERVIMGRRHRPPIDREIAALDALQRGEIADAQGQLQGSRSLMAHVIRAGANALTTPGRQVGPALEGALATCDVELDRGLRLLAVFAGVAPLLGLLGTVTGMISTFDVVAIHGTGEPRLLSGGIAEALTTTQLGLIVAVPALLLHAGLSRRAERLRLQLEETASALEALAPPAPAQDQRA